MAEKKNNYPLRILFLRAEMTSKPAEEVFFTVDAASYAARTNDYLRANPFCGRERRLT